FAMPETYNLQESWQRGLSMRPEVLQARLSLEKQNYVVKYQRNQLFPELDLTGSYGYNATAGNVTDALGQWGGQENPFWTVGGQMSYPIGNRSARNRYREAKATKIQTELQLKQLEQGVMIQIENALAVANTSFQRVQATREARVFAEAAL